MEIIDRRAHAIFLFLDGIVFRVLVYFIVKDRSLYSTVGEYQWFGGCQ